MKFRIILLTIFTLITTTANAEVMVMRSFTEQKGDARTALIIGNSDYKTSPLDNPVNDAQDIASILQKQHFHITLLTNATQKEMETEIYKFGKRLSKKSGVGLFYFAGHGMQINGANYLIPVDAAVESASDVKYEAIDAGRVLGKMEDAENDLNIVILDACRNNPFHRSFRSAAQGLAQMDAPTGSIIAYATAPGSVAADGNGRNGIYTQNLIVRMQEPGLSIEQVFKNVRKDVVGQTSSKQVPWESSSLTGNFFFVDGDVEVVQQPVMSDMAAQKKADQAMWILVAETTEPHDVERYLEEFPNGTYSTVAQLKLDQLNRPPQPVKPQVDRNTRPVRNVSSDLESFLVMVESPDYRQKYKGAKYIYKRRYGKNPTALKVLGDVLTTESQREGLSKSNVKILIYISKVIALSANGDYVKVLDNVAATTNHPGLKKYAVKYTAYLQKTTGFAK
jgi:hypothetical protein